MSDDQTHSIDIDPLGEATRARAEIKMTGAQLMDIIEERDAARLAWAQATDSIPIVAAAWARSVTDFADDIEAFAATTLQQLPRIQQRCRDVLRDHEVLIAKARLLAWEASMEAQS